MKKQEKSPEKDLNEVETTKILDAQFKAMVIRIHKDLKGRVGDLSENLKIQLTLKRTQKP